MPRNLRQCRKAANRDWCVPHVRRFRVRYDGAVVGRRCRWPRCPAPRFDIETIDHLKFDGRLVSALREQFVDPVLIPNSTGA